LHSTRFKPEMSEELKAKGNAFFAAGNFDAAIEAFTEAINVDSSNAVLFSNRSAAFASAKRWQDAIDDARQTTQLRPDWGKGWSRLGAALQGSGDLNAALEAFRSGLAVEPDSAQLQKALESAEAAARPRTPREFANPFGDVNLIAKLQNDPRVAPLLRDAAFLAKLKDLQGNPQNLTKYLNDPGMMDVLSVLLNLDQPREAKDECCASGTCHSEAEISEKRETTSRQEEEKKEQEEKTASFKQESSKSPEEIEAAKLKELGNEAYKRKDFANALKFYADALQLTPQNAQLLLNQSAAHFEAGDFDAAVQGAQEAIDLARDVGGFDFTFFGKAFARMANAHFKAGRLEEAVRFYNKSLTEHRTAETLTKLRDTEKLMAERAKAALFNPELAEAARNEGNELFKAGRFVEAVAAYTEAIRRDERDPRALSNRAACYLKLAAIPEGLKDCEVALKLDPKFTRAMIRKAALLFAKRDFSGCLEACDAAAVLDSSDQKHSSEISSQRSKATFEIYKQQTESADTPAGSEQDVAAKIAQDPELGQILSDPVMRTILQQMQTDPAAVQEHMKNPIVAGKIRKLIASGILRTA
jgi:stress-induced-phosphoprotein 1